MKNYKMNLIVIALTVFGTFLYAESVGKDEPHYNSGHDIVNPNAYNTSRDIVQVTFNVDMSGHTISSNGIHIAGGWQGWDPGATLMSDDDDDSVYSVTVQLNSGNYHQFKFVNGNDWSDEVEYIYENECANQSNGDRWLYVPTTENYELPIYCFNSCAPCRGSEILIINNSNNYWDGSIVEQYLNDSFDDFDHYYLDTKQMPNTPTPSLEFLNNFDMIYEFLGDYPWNNITYQMRQWYEEGNKRYIISGQDMLWQIYGQYGDTFYSPGSYQYDILGLTGAYQELYDNCCNGMSRMHAIDGNFLTDPLYDHLNANDLYLNYAPTNEQGHSNYADGLYLRDEAISVMEIFQGDIWNENDPDPGTTLYSGGLYFESYESQLIFFPFNPVALNANNAAGNGYEQIGQSDLSPLILAFEELFYSYDMDVTLSSHLVLLHDTVAVEVNVAMLSDTSFFALQGIFTEYDTGLEFVGFDTAGTLMGSAGWYYTYNTNEDSSEVYFAATGENDITDDGLLLKVLFKAVVSSVEAPVMIHEAVFNADLTPRVYAGFVNIFPLNYGDVDMNGQVQAYDAALVLQHLVNYITLSYNEERLADVTQDTSISALDAAVILQYVVSLIDTLPYDGSMGGMIAGGETFMENMVVQVNQTFMLPINMNQAENILSFEGVIEYDPAVIQINDLVWNQAFGNFFIEEDYSDGTINFVGAGVNRVDGVSELVQMNILALDGLTESTQITLKDFRLNENAVIDVASAAEISLSVLGIDDQMPSKFALHNNYPNPFNPETTIRFDIPEETMVKLIIYDVSGKEVNVLTAGTLKAGFYRIRWNGKDHSGHGVSAGMYLYHIDAGEFSDTKKLILLK